MCGILNIIPLNHASVLNTKKKGSSHNNDTLLYEFDMFRVFQLRKESEGGGLTAFKTLHELDSARGILNCCSLNFIFLLTCSSMEKMSGKRHITILV